jgi:hypothetical protein
MARTAARAAAALAAAALAAADCLPEYETTYVVSTAAGAFTYNLSALCSPTGYVIDLGATNGYSIAFNVGGDSPSACTPLRPAYNSRGAVVQFLSAARPQPADCADPACFDWDRNASARCCDAPCYVLAADWLSFSLLTPEVPASSGFRIDYPPAPYLTDDEYPCSPLPAPNTLPALRTAAIEIACDPLAGRGLQQPPTFREVSGCSYVIQARSTDACPLAAASTPSPTVSPTGSATGTVSATLSGSATGTVSATPTGSATGTVSVTPTGSATGTVSATPTGSATGTVSATPSGSATASRAAAAVFISALDRDVGLFVGGSVAGVAVALVSVALSIRGYCDCFRQSGSGERARLVDGATRGAYSGGAATL